MQQEQFLNVIDRDRAEELFRRALDLQPLPAESCPLPEAWQRVLAEDIVAPINVPGFDRSNVDGFAVVSSDTFGVSEEKPGRLALLAGNLEPGQTPHTAVACGQALAIATGAMVPRGADAVVMIEYTDVTGSELIVRRPATPGSNITFAGADISNGEIVLHRGEILTARETGVLASLGISAVAVIRQPRVAIISTGNELVAPGQPLAPGSIFDSNATVLADAVREEGGLPVHLGIVSDDPERLNSVLRTALARCDLVLLSGGTSKGPGDVSYRSVADLGPPGIIVHGVALKPGKPLCLAAVARAADDPRGPGPTPVVVLPGFPTSAVFTFREFVAPVLRALAGRRETDDVIVPARLPVRINSERGRTEYVLVNLVEDTPTSEASLGKKTFAAYPLGKGSGSVTTFARADGFFVIPRQQEFIETDSTVSVFLLGREIRPADLTVMGSHCLGLDILVSKLSARGFSAKMLMVGSLGGLEAARRRACDVAGIHLWHEASQSYNLPYLDNTLHLEPGYRRLQGMVFRPADCRFEGKSRKEAFTSALADPECRMVNRNRGSGTRALLDELLGPARPQGYSAEVSTHTAVVAAVAQNRADWGIAIEPVARAAGLGFISVTEEHYDFVIPQARLTRPAVKAFVEILNEPETRFELASRGFSGSGPADQASSRIVPGRKVCP